MLLIQEYLDLEKSNPSLYQQILNLQILTHSLAKELKCNKEQFELLYNLSSLYYLDPQIIKKYKPEMKLINFIHNYKNGQEVNYYKHKIPLIISVCDYYNRLRQEYSHKKSMDFIAKYEYYPLIIKKKFNKIIENLLKDLDYSFYDLHYGEEQ